MLHTVCISREFDKVHLKVSLNANKEFVFSVKSDKQTHDTCCLKLFDTEFNHQTQIELIEYLARDTQIYKKEIILDALDSLYENTSNPTPDLFMKKLVDIIKNKYNELKEIY